MVAKPASGTWPVVCILIGASMWGVIWYPMRLVEAQGLSGIWLTLFMYTAAFTVALPRTWRGARDFAHAPGLLLGLLLSAGWTNIAFVEAILAGNILRVLLLFYLSPLWAVVMAWIFLGERPSRLALTSLAVAMAGALIMLYDPRLGFPWPSSLPDWLALSSGFAFALSNIFIRKGQDVSLEAKVFVTWLGVAALCCVIILVTKSGAPTITAVTVGGAMAIGVFGILIMTLLVQYGVTHLPIHRSATLALIELVAGAVSQQLLTNEIVTTKEWIGGGLIVAGAYLASKITSPKQTSP